MLTYFVAGRREKPARPEDDTPDGIAVETMFLFIVVGYVEPGPVVAQTADAAVAAWVRLL